MTKLLNLNADLDLEAMAGKLIALYRRLLKT